MIICKSFLKITLPSRTKFVPESKLHFIHSLGNFSNEKFGNLKSNRSEQLELKLEKILGI